MVEEALGHTLGQTGFPLFHIVTLFSVQRVVICHSHCLMVSKVLRVSVLEL